MTKIPSVAVTRQSEASKGWLVVFLESLVAASVFRQECDVLTQESADRFFDGEHVGHHLRPDTFGAYWKEHGTGFTSYCWTCGMRLVVPLSRLQKVR